MKHSLRAFIPSAGYGERLLPVTRHLPKPLVPVLGSPILERIISRLVASGFREIGLNTHHLAGQVESWVSRSAYRNYLSVFREETLLGTGGALAHAAEFLRPVPFLVHNGDVLSGLDVNLLVHHHLQSGNLVTLAVHDCPPHNRLVLDEGGFLRGLAGDAETAGRRPLPPVAFTGIAVYEPSFLDYLPPGVSHVVPAWLRAAAEGRRIGTLDITGTFWSDLGTPESYARAVRDLLALDGEYFFIHPGSVGCDGASLRGYVVMEEGATVGAGTALRDVILLPGAAVPAGRAVRDTLAGPGYELPISSPGGATRIPDAAVLSPVIRNLRLEKSAVREIGYGGSLRRYLRAETTGGNIVLACSDPGDPDYERHIRYTRFFFRNGIRVPELLGADERLGLAVFEDLGDVSLYTWMKCPRNASSVRSVYRKVLRLMVALHELPPPSETEDEGLVFRVFDADHFRWESAYFLSEFAGRHMGLQPDDGPALSEELSALAERAASFPSTLVHRDFQSQNVMLTDSGEPALIDYQGARLGPAAYDVASLIWDPYVGLHPDLREELREWYLSLRRGPAVFDQEAFLQSLPVCRIQRHMQALGAFAFLSGVRKKRRFLRFVEPALCLLEEDLLEVSCPELGRLVGRIRGAL